MLRKGGGGADLMEGQRKKHEGGMSRRWCYSVETNTSVRLYSSMNCNSFETHHVVVTSRFVRSIQKRTGALAVNAAAPSRAKSAAMAGKDLV